jgi:hypothetical protein
MIKNGRITSTKLGYEDHGILTFWLSLDYGGTCQGFGGYALDSYDKEKECRKHGKYAGRCIEQILKVVGVENWEDIKGKYVRADLDGDGHIGDLIQGIIHILDDDISFYPKETWEAIKDET